MSGARVLYLTYNGLTEPLGRRQVLPYVVGLSRRGWRFRVISFEKPQTADDEARRQVEAELAEVGATWAPRRYHKRPTLPATAFDVAAGTAAALRGGQVDLIHARSTVPALMASAAARAMGVPWIFDVRGLVAEEYADGGHWPRGGALFRLTSGVEGRLLRGASGLVFLTERIRDELETSGAWPEKPVEVIPCAVDLPAFRAPAEARARVRAALGLGPGPVLVYSGSLGSWYRMREMLDFFARAHARIPGLSFLILTPDEGRAREMVEGHPLAPHIHARRVRPEQVPEYLSAADAGLCFLGDHHSKAASSPTKYGEYLAAGLAVVTNPWTGDAARLEGEPAWILVNEFSPEAYAAAAEQLERTLAEPDRLRQAARSLAERQFSLDDALDRYDRLYRRVRERAER
ncbi:MAG TPA: glycosyltransferase [Vicinamibacteria bacterium]|nr:glycosyltransferase [Vicinamibacteria bacterium]